MGYIGAQVNEIMKEMGVSREKAYRIYLLNALDFEGNDETDCIEIIREYLFELENTLK